MSEKQYRMLAPGEVIQEGDEFQTTSGWAKCVGSIGEDSSDGACRRRPIPSPTSPWVRIGDGPVKWPAVLFRPANALEGKGISGQIGAGMNEPFNFNIQDWTHWMPLPPLPEPEKSPAELAFGEAVNHKPVGDMEVALKWFRQGYEAGQKAK